ncbi:hypothetical protein GEMRC1_006299 [Eukaryota sp. GEM-RC1]
MYDLSYEKLQDLCYSLESSIVELNETLQHSLQINLELHTRIQQLENTIEDRDVVVENLSTRSENDIGSNSPRLAPDVNKLRIQYHKELSRLSILADHYKKLYKEADQSRSLLSVKYQHMKSLWQQTSSQVSKLQMKIDAIVPQSHLQCNDQINVRCPANPVTPKRNRSHSIATPERSFSPSMFAKRVRDENSKRGDMESSLLMM